MKAYYVPLKAVLVCLIVPSAYHTGLAQPKKLSRAIINMQTEITFPDNQGIPPQGEGDRMILPPGMAGGMDLQITIYLKGDMTRISSTSAFMNNIIISDQKSRKTTTLIEAMGKKTGFISTEEDEQEMKRQMDSVQSSRPDLPPVSPRVSEIIETNETKKIAGYECRKALIRVKSTGEDPPATEVWYCPDFFAPGLFSGTAGGFMMPGLNALKELKGFPMEYEMKRGNGMMMHMVVSRFQPEAEVDDRIFEIPKGYAIKSVREMQRDGGRLMFRKED
jgi:hypothetical protein